MKLVVAEKPSVARDLARVLGVAPRGKACFESAEWVITWCIGHLVELEEPHAYDVRWKSWRLETLPMLPEPFLLREARHAADQLRAVSKLLKERRFSVVVNACDAGREGELIFRYVYQFAKSRTRVERLWISSLTDDAIKRGLAGLRPGKDFNALADAARSRSEADWLVGMNATRAVTVRGRQTGHDALFSIGRVQTPTLAMLVERERAIRTFEPQRYWEVRAELQTAAGAKVTAHWRYGKQSRLGSEGLANAVTGRATAAEAPVVEQVIAKTQHEPPPLLFDLTTLQRTANRRFGFSAQRTLELAQAMYEKHKLLTYPRTDSRHLTTDQVSELPPLFASLKAVPEYLPFIADLRTRPAAWRAPGKRIVDDSKVHDHHAIIPTGSPIHLERLDADERRLFDLVARRFLGAFFPDAEIAATEVWFRVGAAAPRPRVHDKDPADRVLDALPPPPDRFVARGRVRMVAGWQAVAGIDERAAVRDRTEQRSKDVGPGALADPAPRDEAGGPLPILVEGDVLAGAFLTRARQTTPPPRFTEATLLGAMETAGKSIDDEALRAAMAECGLGTPATRASIIETLLRREYIAREKRDLVPTAIGIQLITALPVASLASPELTGSWEARLSRIARGQDTRAAFMADIAQYVTEMIQTIRR